ncbi:MAG: transketolase, partial [Candidatus Sericytochromatia bacterium]
NRIQSFGYVDEVLALEPLAAKWEAFGWAVRELDGHEPEAIEAALAGAPWEPGRPSVIVARTVKGKGVSFMENQLAWHYKTPDDQQLARALEELEVLA